MLELQKNLISLGTLAKDGLKYSGEGDWLRVSKGALVVMKGMTNPHGICVLYACKVRGTMTISHLDQYDDERKFWHHKSGNVN